MSCIHYKFKSSMDYDTLTFDGLHISLADLKKAIIDHKKLGKSGDFHLQITDAQTKQAYVVDSELIPRNASVIVTRVPIGGTSIKSKIVEEALKNAAALKQPSFGISGVKSDHMQSHKSLSANNNQSEEDQIAMMMKQSTRDYDPSNYVKPKGPTGVPKKGYTCYRCNKPGHFIQNCPIKPAENETEIIKKPSRYAGIPKDFLTVVPESAPGARMTNQGVYAVPTIDRAAFAKGKKEKPPFVPQEEALGLIDDEKIPIPGELICPICKGLLKDAVVIPCCGTSFCDECVRNALMSSEEHICPMDGCGETDVVPNSLIPNKFLRTAVVNFLNETGYAQIQKKVRTDRENSPSVVGAHAQHSDSPDPPPPKELVPPTQKDTSRPTLPDIMVPLDLVGLPPQVIQAKLRERELNERDTGLDSPVDSTGAPDRQHNNRRSPSLLIDRPGMPTTPTYDDNPDTEDDLFPEPPTYIGPGGNDAEKEQSKPTAVPNSVPSSFQSVAVVNHSQPPPAQYTQSLMPPGVQQPQQSHKPPQQQPPAPRPQQPYPQHPAPPQQQHQPPRGSLPPGVNHLPPPQGMLVGPPGVPGPPLGHPGPHLHQPPPRGQPFGPRPPLGPGQQVNAGPTPQPRLGVPPGMQPAVPGYNQQVQGAMPGHHPNMVRGPAPPMHPNLAGVGLPAQNMPGGLMHPSLQGPPPPGLQPRGMPPTAQRIPLQGVPGYRGPQPGPPGMPHHPGQHPVRGARPPNMGQAVAHPSRPGVAGASSSKVLSEEEFYRMKRRLKEKDKPHSTRRQVSYEEYRQSLRKENPPKEKKKDAIDEFISGLEKREQADKDRKKVEKPVKADGTADKEGKPQSRSRSRTPSELSDTLQKKGPQSPRRKKSRSLTPLRGARSPLRNRTNSRSPFRRAGSRSPGRRGGSPFRRGGSRTPTRKFSRSPGRWNSRSPGRWNSRSPGRKLSRSPRRFSRSPGRRSSKSPGRWRSISPGRKLSRSPGRRPFKSPGRGSRSPIRRGRTKSPMRWDASRSPGRRGSRSPRGRSPMKRRRNFSQSPSWRRSFSRSPFNSRRSRSPPLFKGPKRHLSRTPPLRSFSRSPRWRKSRSRSFTPRRRYSPGFRQRSFSRSPSRGRRRFSRSPWRKGFSRSPSPKRRLSRSPHFKRIPRSPLPLRKRSRTPPPKRRSFSRSPKRLGPGMMKKTARRTKSKTPDRKLARSPYRRSSPKRRSKSPRRRSKSPRRRSKSPIRNRKFSPKPKSKSPAPKSKTSPMKELAKSPTRKKSVPPEAKKPTIPPPAKRKSKTRSPERKIPVVIHQTQKRNSPSRKKSMSPIRKQSKSPIRKKSKSPIRKTSKSPIRKASKSPIRKRSKSPIQTKTKSPMRRKSPPLRKRSPVSKRKSLSPRGLPAKRSRSKSPWRSGRQPSPYSKRRRSPPGYGSRRARRSPSPYNVQPTVWSMQAQHPPTVGQAYPAPYPEFYESHGMGYPAASYPQQPQGAPAPVGQGFPPPPHSFGGGVAGGRHPPPPGTENDYIPPMDPYGAPPQDTRGLPPEWIKWYQDLQEYSERLNKYAAIKGMDKRSHLERMASMSSEGLSPSPPRRGGGRSRSRSPRRKRGRDERRGAYSSRGYNSRDRRPDRNHGDKQAPLPRENYEKKVEKEKEKPRDSERSVVVKSEPVKETKEKTEAVAEDGKEPKLKKKKKADKEGKSKEKHKKEKKEKKKEKKHKKSKVKDESDGGKAEKKEKSLKKKSPEEGTIKSRVDMFKEDVKEEVVELLLDTGEELIGMDEFKAKEAAAKDVTGKHSSTKEAPVKETATKEVKSAEVDRQDASPKITVTEAATAKETKVRLEKSDDTLVRNENLPGRHDEHLERGIVPEENTSQKSNHGVRKDSTNSVEMESDESPSKKKVFKNKTIWSSRGSMSTLADNESVGSTFESSKPVEDSSSVKRDLIEYKDHEISENSATQDPQNEPKQSLVKSPYVEAVRRKSEKDNSENSHEEVKKESSRVHDGLKESTDADSRIVKADSRKKDNASKSPRDGFHPEKKVIKTVASRIERRTSDDVMVKPPELSKWERSSDSDTEEDRPYEKAEEKKTLPRSVIESAAHHLASKTMRGAILPVTAPAGQKLNRRVFIEDNKINAERKVSKKPSSSGMSVTIGSAAPPRVISVKDRLGKRVDPYEEDLAKAQSIKDRLGKKPLAASQSAAAAATTGRRPIKLNRDFSHDGSSRKDLERDSDRGRDDERREYSKREWGVKKDSDKRHGDRKESDRREHRKGAGDNRRDYSKTSESDSKWDRDRSSKRDSNKSRDSKREHQKDIRNSLDGPRNTDSQESSSKSTTSSVNKSKPFSKASKFDRKISLADESVFEPDYDEDIDNNETLTPGNSQDSESSRSRSRSPQSRKRRHSSSSTDSGGSKVKTKKKHKKLKKQKKAKKSKD